MSDTNKNYFHETTIINHENGSKKTLKVPIVQELARHGIQTVPEIFIRPTSETDTKIMGLGEEFPCISIEQLRNNNNIKKREEELKKMAKGLKEWGLVIVKDHGIEETLLSSVKQVIKGFFRLSLEEKKKSVGKYDDFDNMGYGRNFVNWDAKGLDWIDRLTMKVQPRESTYGLNVWPQTPPNFRVVIESYAEEAKKLCDYILQSLAQALSLEKNSFIKYFDPETREINARINYYPPCPEPNSTLGISPHTDVNILTLLMQFGTSGGLQVKPNDKNVWFRVPWPNDALLINVGDLLEIISNGSVVSPWHRVVTQADYERFSLALFFNPPFSTEIEPVKSDDSSDFVYKKVVVGDYIKHFYKLSPMASKIGIKYAMV